MERKILLVGENASLFLSIDKDINTEFGIIKASQLKKAKIGSTLKTHTGKVFFVVDPSTPDFFRKIIRLPQVILPKDIGSIVMYGGVKSGSKILEAGTGSGFSACVMASLAGNGRVISYEMRRDFIKVAKKNVALFGLDNVDIINADIREGAKGKDFDFVLLDMPDPWNAVKSVSKNMRIGARLCSYSPSIIQIEKTIAALPPELKVERLINTDETEWKVELDRGILRPESSGIKHTAFLIFMRKIKK
jgi:tRNA (adenine57-N1/adenine58-N1)-methyltransferase